MPLASGSRIGPYEIGAPIGAGGMGEVFRAYDTRLHRDVAVKVLPPAFSRDPERMRRFLQEAQAIAALSHPNILAIHDFGEHEGSPYIVMEYLEGESLRQRLNTGPLTLRKTIEVAEQIARGLAAAHEKGIVHRDLKPENIFVTRDGRVKILDFGLAKLPLEESTPDAPTLASQTEPGVVMGTVGYMSPEQGRGKAADARSDLFSFGAILYEMLAGRRAFRGETSVEIMSAVLKEDPPNFAGTDRSIPPALELIVRHCLEKNPEERFQSARDVGFALGTLSIPTTAATSIVSSGAGISWRRWAGVAAELVLLVVAVSLLLTRHSSTPIPNMQAAIPPPPGDGFWASITQPAAISPDGRFLALIAISDGTKKLWLRRLDTAEAQPIAGSEDAANPFWSPDSRYLAFFVPGKLRKFDLSGGALSDICPSGSFGMGGSWSSNGVIVFSTFGIAVRRVPASGGTPEAIPGVELSPESVGHLWPSFLPDGKHFLYLDWRYPTRASHDDGVWIGSLDGEKARRLPISSTNAHYSAGYLLFSRDGDLLAQKFDLSRLELAGAAYPVARDIEYDTFFHDGMFSVSANGMLVYASAGVGVNTILTWFDRKGRTLGVIGAPGQMFKPAVAPDGKHVAVNIKPIDARDKIWIYDVDRGTRVPIDTDESGPSLYAPRWSADGKQIAYRDTVGKKSRLLVHSADGSGQERQAGGISDELVEPTGWSPDGRYIAFESTQFEGRWVWHSKLRVAQVEGMGKPVIEIEDAGEGVFSPNGRWLAYSEETSGEIYVIPFPGPGGRIAVSSGGGFSPRWRGDGKELFYLNNDRRVIAVQILESAREFRVLSSEPLFQMQLPWNVGFYDVTRDGQRFLMNTRTHKEQTEPLTLMTNWTAQLQREANALPSK